MKCRNCHHENDPKDKFCSNCGMVLVDGTQNASDYEDEIRQFSRKQEETKQLERIDDLDLDNQTGLLKAQLRLLVSIYRKLETLENNDKQKVRITDFDMPFWSLVSFEFKIFLVSLFFMSIFSCVFYWIISTVFKGIVSLPFVIP